MTLQDIFTKVWNYYIVERNPAGARPGATNNGGSRWIPYYGGAKALRKDPVTLFDSDSVMLNAFGSLEYNVRENPDRVERLLSDFPQGGVSLLIEIQCAHDNAIIYHGIDKEFYAEFEQSLRQVARQFQVEIPNV